MYPRMYSARPRLLPSPWCALVVASHDLAQHNNTVIPSPRPPPRYPHRSTAMSWIEGLPHQRTPDLIGQKLKIWWNDDTGKFISLWPWLSGGKGVSVCPVRSKYVPMRVQAREVACDPCTVPAGWPWSHCPARARPGHRKRQDLGQAQLTLSPPPTRPPSLQAGNFTWEKWWATNQRKARSRWFTMTRHSSGRRGKRSR